MKTNKYYKCECCEERLGWTDTCSNCSMLWREQEEDYLSDVVCLYKHKEHYCSWECFKDAYSIVELEVGEE